jgi:hypothetical protein
MGTIYLHPQLAPPVQQYQHNVGIVVVLQRVLLAIVDIIWHLLPLVGFVLILQTAILVTKLLTLV